MRFKVGHIVRYTRAFIHNTGQYASNRINGRVEEVLTDSRAFEGWPKVSWNDMDVDDDPILVNPVNLELDPKGAEINRAIQ